MSGDPKMPAKTLQTNDLLECCAEAQADGVPCPTLGRSCEVCERALEAAQTRRAASGTTRDTERP